MSELQLATRTEAAGASTVQGKVCAAIALALNFQEAAISPDDVVYDLGLDSISIVALLAELEAAYGVEFGSDRIIEMLQAERVRDLAVIVSQVIGGAPVAASA